MPYKAIPSAQVKIKSQGNAVALRKGISAQGLLGIARTTLKIVQRYKAICARSSPFAAVQVIASKQLKKPNILLSAIKLPPQV